MLTVSRDRDIPDEEMLVFLSDDQGRSWRQATNWPTADQRGEHVGTHLIALPDGQAIVLNTMGLFPTGQAGRYILPSWRSGDGGHTWTKPVGMPVWGILPKLVTLADGTVLLASGRPDVTLSLSVDGGRRWPMTYRFLEDGKPLDASTRNNTMIAIGPQTVLYMYDHGGYHALPPEFEGPARVVAHTIDVTRG